MLLKLTWRNLWRRKRRTLITAFTVAGGIFFSVAFTATGDYAYTNMIDTSATMGFGHITVEPAGYNDSPALQKRLRSVNEIREAVQNMDGVIDSAVRISGQVMFASASKSVGGLVIGVDPRQESADTNIYIRSIVEGAMFDDTAGKGIVVGVKMAKKLKLRLGRKIIYTTTDVDGEIVSELARVTGMFKTGVDEVDGSIALLPIDRVRAVLGYANDEATLVSIFLDDQRHADEMKNKISAIIGNGEREILTWSQTQAEIAGMVAIDRRMNYLSQFLVGLLISAGILNTMFMSVLERKREFGIMMAVGMSPFSLFKLVLMESFWIGMLGLVMGIIITVPAYIYMANTGIDLSSLIEEGADLGGVLIDPVMRYRLYKESVVAILAGVLGLTMLAGLYPAYRAGATPPVENLKTI